MNPQAPAALTFLLLNTMRKEEIQTELYGRITKTKDEDVPVWQIQDTTVSLELRGGIDEHGEHVIEWRWLLKVPLKEQKTENHHSNQIP